MSKPDRREFFGQLGAAAIAIPGLRSVPGGRVLEPSPASAASQVQAAVPYDLLIAGGRVVDPSQKLSAERDVAISNGKIARIETNIPPSQARQLINARGKIVTPGLINIHSHVFNYGISTSTDPERIGIRTGCTTIVDAGSTGAWGFLGFRKYVIDHAATRIYALLNISTIGCCAREIYLAPELLDQKAAIGVIEANRDVILGVKVRVNGRHSDLAHDIEVMRAARAVADATGLPIMMHWSNEPDLLAIMKRGDILTHPFNPPSPNSANLLGADGTQSDKVLSQILALKDRGIWTDGQAATSHNAWVVSEKATKQGWFPDSISPDLGKTPEEPYGTALTTTMSQYLYLGLTLDQVIERVTTNPGRMLKYPEKIGTLETGATADVAILDLQQGNFEFRDGTGQTRMGRQKFVPVATVKSGKVA
jgi:dihydroorotase